jgi:hypothetical protein
MMKAPVLSKLRPYHPQGQLALSVLNQVCRIETDPVVAHPRYQVHQLSRWIVECWARVHGIWVTRQTSEVRASEGWTEGSESSLPSRHINHVACLEVIVRKCSGVGLQELAHHQQILLLRGNTFAFKDALFECGDRVQRTHNHTETAVGEQLDTHRV